VVGDGLPPERGVEAGEGSLEQLAELGKRPGIERRRILMGDGRATDRRREAADDPIRIYGGLRLRQVRAPFAPEENRPRHNNRRQGGEPCSKHDP